MRARKPKTKPLHRSALRRWHSLAGLVSALFLIGLSVSGIYLNHQDDWFRSSSRAFDVSRVSDVLLVDGERYLTTDRGVYVLQHDGSVRPNPVLTLRNISSLQYVQGRYWILTRSGLMMHSETLELPRWTRVSLPADSGEAFSFSADQNAIMVRATTGVYHTVDNGMTWTLLAETSWSLRSFMHQLHTGWIADPWLIYAHDFSALILIFLIGSGLIIYWRLFKKGLKATEKKSGRG